MDPPNPLAVRPIEAARLLGLSRSRLFQEIATGQLPSTKVGRARLIPVSALRSWLNRHIKEEKKQRP